MPPAVPLLYKSETGKEVRRHTEGDVSLISLLDKIPCIPGNLTIFLHQKGSPKPMKVTCFAWRSILVKGGHSAGFLLRPVLLCSHPHHLFVVLCLVYGGNKWLILGAFCTSSQGFLYSKKSPYLQVRVRT
jgi:hypothetical protein